MTKYFFIIILLITNIYGQINRTNGDINDDGQINVADIVTLVSYILDDTVNENGDLNQDGFLDILDVVLLVNEAVGALLPFILTKILPLPMF